jgi:glucose-6-phosphate 1-epimerase
MSPVPSPDNLVGVALPPSVRLVTNPQDSLPRVEVSTKTAHAEVFFHGAQVTRWAPQGNADVLWVSARGVFRPDKAIRGGVPICLPWFGAHPTDPSAPGHGFARLADWSMIDAAEAPDGTVTLAFTLANESAEAHPHWAHPFRATFTVGIGSSLRMALRVENTGDAPFSFEEALHTYFTVGDIREVSVAGLEDTDYLDKVEGFARHRQGANPITFSGETDRVYLDTTATCRIVDPILGRTIVIEKGGSRSTVVWNPWIDRSRDFADFGDDEWLAMVCVETCNVRDAAVRLAPGEHHTMSAKLRIAD